MQLPEFPWSRFPDAAGEKPPNRRLWWILAGSLGGLVGVVLFIWLVGWPRLQRRLEARDLRQVEEYIAQKDYRRAQLSLEQAAQVNPRNFAARRRLADFYMQAGSLQSLTTWRELVEVEPENDANRLGWANAALHFGALPVAREALAGVSATGRATADYHRVAAGVALAAGDKNTLLRELKALAQTDPASVRLHFNAVAVAMLGADADEAAEARR